MRFGRRSTRSPTTWQAMIRAGRNTCGSTKNRSVAAGVPRIGRSPGACGDKDPEASHVDLGAPGGPGSTAEGDARSGRQSLDPLPADTTVAVARGRVLPEIRHAETESASPPAMRCGLCPARRPNFAPTRRKSPTWCARSVGKQR